MKKEEKSYPQLNEKFEDCIPKPQTIWFKLWKAKQEIEAVTKGSDNPFFKSKYADLNTLIDAVEPVLFKYNLILLQPVIDNKVVTQVIDCENGDMITSSLELPHITDPQKLIASITYYRRGSLQSLLAMRAVDDDGNTAREAVKTQKPTISQDRFEAGLTKVEKGEMTAEAFKKALSGYELTELQTKALMLL
jgi:hypothetical protein